MTTTASPAAPSTTEPHDDTIGRDDISALLCCEEPTYRAYLATALRELGFKVHHAAGHPAARHRLDGRPYHVIVMLEDFDGSGGLADHATLRHLRQLDTDERRRLFVALVGRSFETDNADAAYAFSVDLVVRYEDVAQFGTLLEPAFQDRREEEQFFRAQAEAVG